LSADIAVKSFVNDATETEGVDVLVLVVLALLLVVELGFLAELPQAATARPATSDTTTAKPLPLSKCMNYLLLLLSAAAEPLGRDSYRRWFELRQRLELSV
jgi:hypothetical protein